MHWGLRGILYYIFLHAGIGSALPCSYDDDLKRVWSNSREITRVAEYGGSGRKVAEHYAKVHHERTSDVEDRYASSGELKCGDFTSGAELVVTQSTVLVALHGVFKDRSCELITPLDQCHIRFKKNGKNQFFDIESIRASGAPCPHAGSASKKNDWLILNLETSAKDFKPYQVRSLSNDSSKQVVGVGQSVNFYQQVGKKHYLPMHYSDCQIMDFYSDGLLGTTCGGSGASSGGGIFDQDRVNPHLEGIHIEGSDDASMIKDEVEHHRVINRPYDSQQWTSIYLPITGRLQSALAGLSAPPKAPVPEPSPGESNGEDI